MSRASLNLSYIALGACLALSSSMPAHADVLLIERIESAQHHALPLRGQHMAAVESRFGAPLEKRAPVGGDRPRHPPITRWVYPDFSVYFERDRVIDAVLSRTSDREIGPKPTH